MAIQRIEIWFFFNFLEYIYDFSDSNFSEYISNFFDCQISEYIWLFCQLTLKGIEFVNMREGCGGINNVWKRACWQIDGWFFFNPKCWDISKILWPNLNSKDISAMPWQHWFLRIFPWFQRWQIICQDSRLFQLFHHS